MIQTLSVPVYGTKGKVIVHTQTARLIYVNDSKPGILRTKKGTGFVYTYQDKRITDKIELDRIRKIVIPPAWSNVWICKSANGHIQATGFDLKGRKQYRYHPFWNQARNQDKFNRLLAFGEKMPLLRQQLEKDLAHPELDERKVLATVVSLMERTYIRIGSNAYEKLYGSYGLTTLKDKHVTFNGDSIRFSFLGKKGIHHSISLKNKKLARIVKQCREIPGKELFQYYDGNNAAHAIDSGQVNNYIKEITGEEFTAKDFRTWAGTLHALCVFSELGEAATQTECKKNIVEALDYVSKKLGNTRTVCKKYYVHPLIIDLYENQALHTYLQQYGCKENKESPRGWSKEEQVLMKLLQTTPISGQPLQQYRNR